MNVLWVTLSSFYNVIPNTDQNKNPVETKSDETQYDTPIDWEEICILSDLFHSGSDDNLNDDIDGGNTDSVNNGGDDGNDNGEGNVDSEGDVDSEYDRNGEGNTNVTDNLLQVTGTVVVGAHINCNQKVIVKNMDFQ